MLIINEVNSIMIPVDEYPRIRQDAGISEAIYTLKEFFYQKEGTWYGFRSLLVLDHNNTPTGILTLKGLLNAFKHQDIINHLLKGDPTGLFFLTSYQDKFQNKLNIKVKDLMRPIGVVSVDVDAPIIRAIELILKHKVNTLPVMHGNQLAGMVRTIDIFSVIGELLE